MKFFLGRKSMDEWIKIKQLTKDAVIYHYTSAPGIMGIIEYNKFWVSRSDFLNDESELNYIHTVIESVCTNLIQDIALRNIVLDKIHDKKQREDYHYEYPKNRMQKGYYILSFSTREDSITLWSEYANFRGYCITFDYNNLIQEVLKQNKNLLAWHGSVIYNVEEQEKYIIEALTQTAPAMLQKDFDQIITGYYQNQQDDDFNREFEALIDNFMMICTIYSMFFKQECFKEEYEYRIVFLACHNNISRECNTEMKFREKDGVLMPYIEVEITNDKVALPIRAIVAAPQNSMNLGVRGIEYFLQSKGYNTPVRKSKIPLRY